MARWFVLLLAAGCAVSSPAGDPTADVRAMLDRSAAAWNRGDLNAFVSDYASDSTTTFVSGGRVRRGITWIRDNYAPRFAAGAERDSLRFEEVAARAVGADYLLATARFELYRRDTVTSSGPFTLILHRVGDEWKIIHDHTSRDDREQ